MAGQWPAIRAVGQQPTSLLNRGLHLLSVESISLLEILQIQIMLNGGAGNRLVVDGYRRLAAESLDPGIAEIHLGNTSPHAAGLELHFNWLGACKNHRDTIFEGNSGGRE